MITVLATGLADAVRKDEAPEEGGFDLSAGMFGAHVSAWIRATADDFIKCSDTPVKRSFQARVSDWMLECFGERIALDTTERNHRFLEESLELVQSLGCTESEALQLVAYVFGRPTGDPAQEIGGVMVTLAALCATVPRDMDTCAEQELASVWTKIEKIRAKNASKPKHSPLPGSTETKVRHLVTCKLFPDPFDERDPVGPCTCGASGDLPHFDTCRSKYSARPLPAAWKVTEKPNGGAATYHRARWVDGVLKCWECPAEYTPPDRSV